MEKNVFLNNIKLKKQHSGEKQHIGKNDILIKNSTLQKEHYIEEKQCDWNKKHI